MVHFRGIQLWALLLAGVWSQQKPLSGKSPFTKDFVKLVHESLEKWHVPGKAIGVVDGDDTFIQVCIHQVLRTYSVLGS